MKKPRLCRECNRVATETGGYCKAHASLYKPKNRSSVWRSRRGRKWREAFLVNHPYCRDCMVQFSRPVPATEVHHVIEQHERPDLALDADNCVPLCETCHGNRHGAKTVLPDGGVGGSES